MNTQTLTAMIDQSLTLADTGIAALKQRIDEGETTAADQLGFLNRKRQAIQSRRDSTPSQPEARADAPQVGAPTNGEARQPVQARTAQDTKQPTVRKSNVLPRRSIKPKAAGKSRAAKPALAKK